MKRLTADDLRPMGFVVKPHGFKGEVILGLDHGDAEDFPETDFIFLLVDGLPVPYRLLETRTKSGQLIARLEDVDTEEEAKKLNGVELWLQEDLIDTESDEVGLEALTGFTVIDRLAGKIGLIESIEEFPMQLLARLTYLDKEVLFPLNDTIVVSVDPEAKEIFTELPEGLLDVYTDDSPENNDEEDV
ncbi:MAG: ribosome maturation factor RimM [Bacteroidota bacterium]